MKKYLFTLTLLVTSLQLWSAPVTQQQARSLAVDFMARRGIGALDPQPLKAPRHPSVTQTDTPAFYVFNATDKHGYVIISGDDRTAPVLGYADSGSFDADNLSEGLAWLLQSYEEQLLSTSASDEEQMPSTSGSRQKAPGELARRNISPLLSTLWNQGNPYNLLCPRYYNEDGTEGDRSATGCVATAIAQVMGYYRYPEKTLRVIPGYMQTYDTSQGTKNVRLNSIPAGSVIDWDHILPDYNGGNFLEEEKTAIAQLMYWVGLGCKMDYGSQSGAGFSEGVKALINYFGYDDGSHIAYRGQYTIDGWSELLYRELQDCHPIAFAGTNSGGAHAFVIDGYDIDGLFHLNWGWGGLDNGYFRIDILAPDDQSGIGASPSPDGYNMGQEAIILRLPDDERAPAQEPHLTINDWELRNGGRSFFANFVNWSGVSATWNAGIAEILDDGSLQLIGNSRQVQLDVNTYYGFEFSFNGLSEGTHRVVPVSKRTVSTLWQKDIDKNKYVLVEVDANRQVINASLRPIEDIAVTSITFPGTLKVNDNQQVCVNFANYGDEYMHEIHMLVSKTKDKGEAICRTALTMKEGGEGTATFNFKPDSEGTWHIWLALEREGRNILAEDSVVITNNGVTRERYLRYASHTVTNRSNGNIIGTRTQGKVTIMNQSNTESYDGMIRLWLFKLNPNDGYYYGANSVYVNMHIEPRKTAQADYYFNNLEIGGQYVMSILYGEGGDIQDGGLKPMGTVRAGALYWQQNQSLSGLATAATINTPAGAVAIDLSEIGGSYQSVRPNANPNTLYFIGYNDEVPEELKGHNVVRGRMADSLLLADGYGFFSPYSFIAMHTQYSRSLPENSRQWQTVILPYSIAKLPQDVEVLSFDRQDDEGNVHFEPVATTVANVPYVIRSVAAQADSMVIETSAVQVLSSLETPLLTGTSDYRFTGTTLNTAITVGYVLNDEGTAFIPIDSRAQIKPFRAYFTTLLPHEQQISEIVIDPTGELGIEMVANTRLHTDTNAYYDLYGRRITSPQRAGVYINNGRKVVIR